MIVAIITALPEAEGSRDLLSSAGMQIIMSRCVNGIS